MYKFKKFNKIFDAMHGLENAVVRFSSDSVTGETVAGPTTSTIFSDEKQLPDNAFICQAYTRGGKCADCRACWDKNIPVIAYPGHGSKMLKIQSA